MLSKLLWDSVDRATGNTQAYWEQLKMLPNLLPKPSS